MQEERPFVMSIAGLDPSGGAGLLADIKTFEQLKVTGLGVCTALTLQTASQCMDLEWRPLHEIVEAIDVLMANYKVSAVKIGIVKDAEYLDKIVGTAKTSHAKVKIIWDPVLKSSSGFTFFDEKTFPLLENIVNKIDLITPNYSEYRILKDNNVLSDSLCSVLIKGGHREDAPGTDILVDNKKETVFSPDGEGPYYPKHGSGCVLSSAIASGLAKGEDVETACRNGKLYIEKFLKSSSSLLGTHS